MARKPTYDELAARVRELEAQAAKLHAVQDDLRRSEGRLRQAAALARMGVWEWDVETDVTTWSEEMFRIYGIRAEDFTGCGTDYFEYTHPDDRELQQRNVREAFERAAARADKHEAETEINPRSFRILREDGTIVHTEGDAVSIVDESGQPVRMLGILRDVTARVEAEQQRVLLATAIEQADEIFVVTNVDGCIRYVNPAFERITGYSREEAVGEYPSILKSGLQGDDFYEDLWTTILSGDVWHGRFVNRRCDGTLYHEDATISPVRDPSGKIVYFVAIKRDITREVELEKSVRQMQKMESIGILAGGIAHDFNNFLAVIMGSVEVALMEQPESSPLREDLGQALAAAEHSRDLVQQILSFSRQAPGDKEELAIDLVAKEALRFLRSSIPTTVEIRSQIASAARILANPTQVRQVIMNLCTNAYQAVGADGVVEVEVQPFDVDSTLAGTDLRLHSGPYVRLEVRDNGCGMDAATVERIFEPFFTTKPVGKGTGMGLAVVHGIVNDHGGSIQVRSVPGRGTSVTVYLPRLVSEEPLRERRAGAVRRGSEHILLVDDEPLLLQTVGNLLRTLGYRVTSSPAGHEALELFRRDPASFDGIVTDQTMPRMTGAELATRALEIRPGLPVLLCTGYSDAVDEAKASRLGVRGFLRKPFSMVQLSELLRQVLD